MADWSRPFHHPIDLSDGRRFETLLDCATYITTKLKKRESDEPKWRLPMRVLIEAAERGFMDFAKTSMLGALFPPLPPIGHTGITGSGDGGAGN